MTDRSNLVLESLPMPSLQQPHTDLTDNTKVSSQKHDLSKHTLTPLQG